MRVAIDLVLHVICCRCSDFVVLIVFDRSPTYLPSAPSTNDQIARNDNTKLIRTWNNTGTFVFLGFIAFGIVVLMYVYYQWSSTNRLSDTVNFVAIIRYIHQVLDLWTDLSFCVVLYYEELYNLTILSFIFVIVPYLISIFVSIYSIFKWTRWRQDHPSRLKHYLKSYEFAIILFSLFGGFYATIDLFRSKILYLRIMYFPLKQSEYNHLKYLRFVNFILLENLPQFAIQLYYLTNYSSGDENSSVLPIVFLSISLTIVSLLFGGIKVGISAIDECINSPKRKFAYETKIDCNFMIEFDNLRSIQAFCHSKMQRCILTVLNTCNDRTYWVGRSDVFYSIECYHIDCEYYLNQLGIYFELTVFTMNENHKTVIQKFSQNIIEMLQLDIGTDVDVASNSNSFRFQRVSSGFFIV